jgi:tetratricopeptide (TPR) repeat protein
MIMKGKVFFLTLLISVAWISTAQTGNVFTDPVKAFAAQVDNKLDKGDRIVVLGFDSNNYVNLSNYLMNSLMGQFVNNKKVTVVDSKLRDLAINEIRIDLAADLADKNDDRKKLALGHFVGAQYIVSGSCKLILNDYKLIFFATNTETDIRIAQYEISINKNNAQNVIDSIERGAVQMPVVSFASDPAYDDIIKAFTSFYYQQPSLAIDQFSDAVKKNKDCILAYRGRAFACFYSQRFKEALSDFNQVIEINKKYDIPDVAAYYQRGMTQYFIGYQSDNKASYQAALKDFNYVLGLVTNNPDGLYETLTALGPTYFRLLDYAAAETSLNKAIELRKQLPLAYTYLGQMYLAQKKYALAEKNFNKVLEIGRNRDFYALYCLGLIYLDQNNYALAEKSFNSAIEFSENNLWFKYQGFTGLSELYLKKGDTKKSLEYLASAANCDPGKTCPHAYFLRGAIYLKSGDTGNVRNEFLQIKRIEANGASVTDMKDLYERYAPYVKSSDIERVLN